MEIVKLATKPFFNKKMISNFKRINNDGISFTSITHPELRTIKINKTSSYICKLCNGKNTITDIINKLSSKYPKVTKEQLKSDMEKILFQLYKLKIITWESSDPYEYLYNKKIESNIDFKILKEDELILNYLSESNLIIRYDQKQSLNYYLDEVRYKQFVYLGIEQYSAIMIDGHIKFLISLSTTVIKNSVDLHIILFDNKDESNINQYIDMFLEWSIEQYNKVINKNNIGKINTILYENDTINGEFLNELGFNYIGYEKDCILNNNEYNSMYLYSKII